MPRRASRTPAARSRARRTGAATVRLWRRACVGLWREVVAALRTPATLARPWTPLRCRAEVFGPAAGAKRKAPLPPTHRALHGMPDAAAWAAAIAPLMQQPPLLQQPPAKRAAPAPRPPVLEPAEIEDGDLLAALKRCALALACALSCPPPLLCSPRCGSARSSALRGDRAHVHQVDERAQPMVLLCSHLATVVRCIAECSPSAQRHTKCGCILFACTWSRALSVRVSRRARDTYREIRVQAPAATVRCMAVCAACIPRQSQAAAASAARCSGALQTVRCTCKGHVTTSHGFRTDLSVMRALRNGELAPLIA